MYRLTFCLLFLCHTLFAQLNVVADKTTAIYGADESMNFIVTSNQTGTVSYKIFYDRFVPVIASGTLELSAGETAFIPYQNNEAGIAYCHVYQNGQKAFAAAAFDPFNIQAIGEAPTDLDAYWDSKKALLEQIPIDPQIETYESHPYSTTYRVSLANLDNRRVYGLISVPDGNTEETYPAILTLPPFGNNPSVVMPEYILAERIGALSMTISIHNVPTDQVDPIGYEENDSADPDSIYYLNALTGAMRILDYIESRPDYNGYTIVNGVSQGGGLSMLLSGIDDRVDLMAQSNGALCQHSGILENKASGFPYYITNSRFEVNEPEHEAATIEAVKYYDAVYLNRNIDFPTYHVISYEDTITPSATVFAAYNQIIAPKVLLHAKELGHSHPNEYISRRREFYRQHIPEPLFPTWPFPDTTTGYFVDAGMDITIPFENSTTTLEAVVKFNDVLRTDFPANWDLVSGPSGTISMSAANSYTNTISLNESGEYLFRFTAFDAYEEVADMQFSVQDYVKITVEEPVSTDHIFSSNTRLFPNPTNEKIQIEWAAPITGSLRFYNAQGQIVQQFAQQEWSGTTSFDLSDFSAGIYWVVLDGLTGRFSKKVVKVK